MKLLTIFAAAAIVLFQLACSTAPAQTATPAPTATPDPCSPTEVQRFTEAIRDVSRKFDDAVKLADSTPRMSLVPVIQDMQEIRRDAEDLKVPPCAEKAKSALVDYMDMFVQTFTAFLAQKSETEVNRIAERAQVLLGRYETEIEKLSAKKPAG